MIVSPRLLWSGIFLGLIGCLFYANFRAPIILFDAIPLFEFLTVVSQPILLPSALSEWIPSFLHVLGMSLFTAGFYSLTKGNYWKIPLAWLLIDLAFEALQYFQTSNLLTWGNFEWVDIAALFIGALGSGYILKRESLKQAPIKQVKLLAIVKPLSTLVVVTTGSFMMLGSYVYECQFPDGSYITEEVIDGHSTCDVDPLYVRWDTIRTSGQLASEIHGEDYRQPLKATNKIYTYQHLLLINEKNLGVHLYDNSDPQQPTYLDFIALVGNQDMAIKDNFLYLDSFTDLLVFDLLEIESAPYRTQNVFAMPNSQDLRQLLPDISNFTETPKASKGVVIGYVNHHGRAFYFWPEFEGMEDDR